LRVALNLEQLLSPSPGGVGRYAARLAAGLVSLGVEVQPVVARHEAAQVRAAWQEFGLEGMAPTLVLPLPRPVLYDAWHLLGWPPGHWAGVDIVHTPSLAVPPKGGKPLVVSIHDAAPWLYPEAFTARGRWFHAVGARAAARRADVVLTGTQAAAAEISVHLALPAGRARVVPYGVDIPNPAPGPEEVGELRGRRGLGQSPYVLWVGSLEPRKGVGTLVAAMALLMDRHPPEREGGPLLVLAGYAGWHNRDLLPAAAVDLLGPRLVRLGRVPESDLRVLYAGASLFAFPSRHEGFGLPVLEAMASGAPVVASDIAAIREVAGDAAVLVPPEDPVAWADVLGALLADDARRRGMAAAGRARAELYPWAATAAATVGVYRELLR
jgi:glycosyltransferase involved in cell wall biosynthesis